MPFDMVSLEMLHYIIVNRSGGTIPTFLFFPVLCQNCFLYSFFKYRKSFAPWAKIPALRRHHESEKHQWFCWNTERINATSSISPLLKSRTNSGISNSRISSFDFSVLCLMGYSRDGELYMTIIDIAQCVIVDIF